MNRNTARRAILTLGVLAALVAPATASAWTVTVHVHGAGKVDDIDPGRTTFECTVGPEHKSESSTFPCVLGTPNGAYGSGTIVELAAVVPQAHFDKGWRFAKWVDKQGGLGTGDVNCDPQDKFGDHTATNCKFQIFENLEVDLYFDDVSGPQDTSISGGPTDRTRFTTASFDFNSPSESTDARYECRLDTPNQTGTFGLCGSPSDKSEPYTGLTANGQYTFQVRAMDPTGNVDTVPAVRSWIVDTVVPTASITGGPANGSQTNSRNAAFTVTPSEPGATVVCALDGNTVPCGTSFTGLAQGQHTFAAQATDQAGNVGPSATRTWTVDFRPPVITIQGTPAADAATKDPRATLTATSDEPGPVTCLLDGESAPCNLDRPGLADGVHTFSASTVDAAGNPGSATRTWTVDTTGPVITITSGPAEGSTINQSSVSFAFSASEPGPPFECALDQQNSFAACTALNGLSDGPHTFYVRKADNLANVTTVQRSFTIDTAVPETALLSGPAEGSTTASNEATLEFASPESGASFECRLDGAEFVACTSPLKLTGLTNADHVFEVRARDAAGNVDATPVRRAWRVNALDADADGVNSPADCDDANAAIRPGATDTPGDGIDQDCAGGDATVVIPPVDSDKDDDGVNAGLDCDDTNGAVRPGAVDVPRDGIDQDCRDGDAAFPVTSASLNYNFKPAGKRTRIIRMVLSKIAVGATVKVTCKGRGCPARSRTVRPSKGTVDVRKLLKRKPLRAGNVLTLSITQPGHTAKVISFKARRGKSPKPAVFRCLEPGTRKLTACP